MSRDHLVHRSRRNGSPLFHNVLSVVDGWRCYGITFRSKVIILNKVVEQDILIIDDVAARCFREGTPSTDSSEDGETKPLERAEREPRNILNRDGQGVNPFSFCFPKVDVNHIRKKTVTCDGRRAPEGSRAPLGNRLGRPKMDSKALLRSLTGGARGPKGRSMTMTRRSYLTIANSRAQRGHLSQHPGSRRLVQ
jgi:hypothetical protein